MASNLCSLLKDYYYFVAMADSQIDPPTATFRAIKSIASCPHGHVEFF